MILLDIEGTTTPIAFVTQTLFPYARTHLRSYLDRHGRSAQYLALMAAFRQEHAADEQAGQPVLPWPAEPGDDTQQAVQAYAEWLMDRDRKSPALKELQGYIWEEGYENGELVGQVFEDVPRAFARWRREHVRLGIFSSGAVLAQRRLFRCSSAGDLSPFLHWYFDTHTGAKQDPESYRRIAEEVGELPPDILFVSDMAGELDAARTAGLGTVMTVRPGNLPQPPHDHRLVTSFDEIQAGVRF
jgi:enolase-phosphatase E1